MPNPIGFSFSPNQTFALNGTVGAASKPPGSSPQSAVEIRNLSLPRVVGPTGLAPSALLNAPGGMGLSQLLPLLMAAFAPQGQQPGVPSLPSTSPFGSFLKQERGLPSPIPQSAASLQPRIIPGGGRTDEALSMPVDAPAPPNTREVLPSEAATPTAPTGPRSLFDRPDVTSWRAFIPWGLG